MATSARRRWALVAGVTVVVLVVLAAGGWLLFGRSDEDPFAGARPAAEAYAGAWASGDLAPLTFASHGYEDFHLLMPLYVCRRWQGIVRPVEGQETRWVRAPDLRKYEMPAADLPLIAPLIELL